MRRVLRGYSALPLLLLEPERDAGPGVCVAGERKKGQLLCKKAPAGRWEGRTGDGATGDPSSSAGPLSSSELEARARVLRDVDERQLLVPATHEGRQLSGGSADHNNGGQLTVPSSGGNRIRSSSRRSSGSRATQSGRLCGRRGSQRRGGTGGTGYRASSQSSSGS